MRRLAKMDALVGIIIALLLLQVQGVQSVLLFYCSLIYWGEREDGGLRLSV